jgi:hypothetical protein
MIARCAIMPHILFTPERGRHDRVFDLAGFGGADRDRGVGGIFMSAEIIQFIPRPNRDRGPTDFPTIAFRSAVRPDGLTMDHVDTAPCEILWPACDEA